MPDNLQPTAFLELHLAGHQSGMPVFFLSGGPISAHIQRFSQPSKHLSSLQTKGGMLDAVQAKSANRIPSWPSLSQVWYASILDQVCQGHQLTFETEAPLQVKSAQNIITDARLGSHPHLWFDLVLVKATTYAPHQSHNQPASKFDCERKHHKIEFDINTGFGMSFK